ncbi:MAG: DUF1338 family protein [Planctomycetota bacterium]
MTLEYADTREMQRHLFAELSTMFAREVPLYDKSLEVNLRCNCTVARMLSRLHGGFRVSDEELSATSGERHGAIRIGREDEFRWISRYFACFGMEPHNFYDMTSVGAKSQPVIATAFRSRNEPENRIFASLLRTDGFDASTRERIDALLSQRQVFSERAMALIERCEVQGGLDFEDAMDLVREGIQRIFGWTGEARGRELYEDLCRDGLKIAADIACFSSHHLNHLTPNTLCIDLYSTAMRWQLGLIARGEFVQNAAGALAQTARIADAHWMLLHFRWLRHDDVKAFVRDDVRPRDIHDLASALAEALETDDLRLWELDHNGYKDATEGPDCGTQILLRQDAYRALSEPVRFIDEQPAAEGSHTARFGEIEQRFYATTPRGRDLYNGCLALQEAEARIDAGGASDAPGPPKKRFAPFPGSLLGLLEEQLVYAVYEPVPGASYTDVDRAGTVDAVELVRHGVLRCKGIRYEDFLPASAAGIFASNLEQYGTATESGDRDVYEQSDLERILGREIVDTDAAYRAEQAISLLDAYASLGVLDRLPDHRLGELEREAHGIGEGVGGVLA